MERMLCYISDVGSVYSNTAFGNVKESRYEIYERWFAAARTADNSGRFTRICGKAYIGQNIFLCIGIAERNVIESNIAPERRFIKWCRIRLISDALFGWNDFVYSLCRNCRSRKHYWNHCQHKEWHYNLHRICDKRHHISDLQRAVRNLSCTYPYNKNGDKVHYHHHKRHHKRHCAVCEEHCGCKILICFIETIFFIFFTAEGTDNRQTGKYLPCNKVQLINQFLHQLEFRHRNLHQNKHHRKNNNYGKGDNPRHTRTGSQYHKYTANAKNRRIYNHSEQHYDNHLYLLYIVRASRDKAGSGKSVNLGTWKADNISEHSGS